MARRPSAERRHRKQHIKIYVQSHARAWLFLYTRDVQKYGPASGIIRITVKIRPMLTELKKGDRLYRSDRYARILHQVERTPRIAEITIMKKGGIMADAIYFS